jgi:thiamine transport system substrate-binding protein
MKARKLRLRRPNGTPLVTISHKLASRRFWTAVLAAAAVVVAPMVAAGCGSGEEAPTEVILVTHDSFAVSKDVIEAFEDTSGLTLTILQGGDAGEMLNKALLSAGNPQGDVLFGVDDNLLSRALAEDLFSPYESDGLERVSNEFLPADDRVTPIDRGDVCLNIDRSYFMEQEIAPPKTLSDLALPRYRDLVVVENAATSTPGLAFLLATVVRFGVDGWEEYWRALRANGVLVVDGWEEAYTQEFSGAAGSPGKRPIVVSYATSPAAEVIFATTPLAESPTAAVEDGCFRQVEYAGVLDGAPNPEGAKKLIDFMLSETFQSDVAGSMFVYPVAEGIALPEAFVKHAIVPADPLSMPADQIDEQRDEWVDTWTEIVAR